MAKKMQGISEEKGRHFVITKLRPSCTMHGNDSMHWKDSSTSLSDLPGMVTHLGRGTIGDFI